MSSRSSRTIYVGNLPGDIREREVEDLFSKVNQSFLIYLQVVCTRRAIVIVFDFVQGVYVQRFSLISG